MTSTERLRLTSKRASESPPLPGCVRGATKRDHLKVADVAGILKLNPRSVRNRIDRGDLSRNVPTFWTWNWASCLPFFSTHPNETSPTWVDANRRYDARGQPAPA